MTTAPGEPRTRGPEIPTSAAVRRAARMPDYAAARRTFSWAAAAARLDGLPGGRGLNIAHEAVDRHVAAGRGDHHALRLLDSEGDAHPVTYAELRPRTNRFAQALERLGVRPGERVFIADARSPRRPTPGCDLGTLRHVVSVGEPLDAATVCWSDAALGTPAHDTWWQTETGAIMIANFAADPVRPGAMGRPVPGIEATVLQRDAEGRVRRVDGHVHEVDAPGTEGELALRTGWPSMSGAITAPRSGRPRSSPTAGTSPGTWSGATPTAGTGSSGAPTT